MYGLLTGGRAILKTSPGMPPVNSPWSAADCGPGRARDVLVRDGRLDVHRVALVAEPVVGLEAALGKPGAVDEVPRPLVVLRAQLEAPDRELASGDRHLAHLSVDRRVLRDRQAHAHAQLGCLGHVGVVVVDGEQARARPAHQAAGSRPPAEPLEEAPEHLGIPLVGPGMAHVRDVQRRKVPHFDRSGRPVVHRHPPREMPCGGIAVSRAARSAVPVRSGTGSSPRTCSRPGARSRCAAGRSGCPRPSSGAWRCGCRPCASTGCPGSPRRRRAACRARAPRPRGR